MFKCGFVLRLEALVDLISQSSYMILRVDLVQNKEEKVVRGLFKYILW